MSDGNSIINLGNISKPATILIKKIAEATGGICKPWQIRRVARAEADAKKILSSAQIEISDLEERALQRLIGEEAKNQHNIEKITTLSLPQLKLDGDSNNIDNDWITNFFDKCRIISDSEMQEIWSKILASEANTPSSFSKRTVNLVASMNKQDAKLFLTLCSFLWVVGELQPLIYNVDADIYKNNGVRFIDLKHLDTIGLINFDSVTGYALKGTDKSVLVEYNKSSYILSFPNDKDNVFKLGNVILTSAGKELAKICEPKVITNFDEFIIGEWIKQGIEVKKI